MVKVILYGFTVGIFSSRKLQRACQENLAFKYLAGMETPAFKTFIEFRRRHREDMKAVFVSTVKLARALGLARLGAVALDGCKLGANTSKHKAMSYGRMQEEERGLKAEIEGMLKKAEHPGEPIEGKKQIPFADHDARCHSKKGEGTEYVYNAQAGVDMESRIIVENHIEDSVQDAHAAGPALENMERDFGQPPEKLVADAGYGNKDTLEACRENEVTPVCATRREGKEGAQAGKLDSFSYERGEDLFVCPHGQVFDSDHERPKDGKRAYRSREVVACECSHYRTADGRGVITVHPGHLAKREFNRIMGEAGHKELYRRRKCTVEPVFGQIEDGMGRWWRIRCFGRRSLAGWPPMLNY
ncbi:MAG: transposase [Elusimicrobia bacterium]|nr:transposase [Elusimicrobiota bacterium]